MLIKGKTIDFKLSDRDIENREKNWRKVLPKEFVEFIKNHNGLIPDERIFIQNGICIENFLCLVDNISESEYSQNDIDVIISKYDEFMVFSEDTIGTDLIPFAKLSKDKLLCLCYKHENPSVVIWSFEGSGEFDPNIEEYSNDFGEFLKSIE